MPSQKMVPGFVPEAWMDIHREDILTAVASDPVLISGQYRNISVGVSGITTGAKIQYTLDPIDLIEAATAQWVDWVSGVVTVNTADNIAGPVTAVRGVATGSCTWHINASSTG